MIGFPEGSRIFVDLAQKWAVALADQAKITAFGWDQAEVTEVLGKITAFLTARTAYEADNSTVKRLAKDEAGQKAYGFLTWEFAA